MKVIINIIAGILEFVQTGVKEFWWIAPIIGIVFDFYLTGLIIGDDFFRRHQTYYELAAGGFWVLALIPCVFVAVVIWSVAFWLCFGFPLALLGKVGWPSLAELLLGATYNPPILRRASR